MPGHGALKALLRLLLLLLLLVRSSRAVVPPPANVYVSCHNVTVSASWNSGQEQPQTSFIVTLKGPTEDIGVIETIDHHCDLSEFIWKSGQHHRDYLYVTVAAARGGNRSEAVNSNSFSFSDLKTVDTKCLLDFPPVDVYVGESGAMVSFKNPLRSYPQLERVVMTGSTPIIRFTISQVTNGTKHVGDFPGDCESKDTMCKKEVTWATGEGDACFRLDGVLSEGDLHFVRFREIPKVCASDSAETHILILPVVLTVAFILVVVVLGLFICKARAWTMKLPVLPPSLQVPSRHPVPKCDPEFPEEETNSVLILGPARSLSDFSEDSAPPQSHGSPGCDRRQSLLYAERQLSDSSCQELLSGGNRTDSDSADYSERTESDLVESDEDDAGHRSAYEIRPTVQVDMGDGDFATGYTGN